MDIKRIVLWALAIAMFIGFVIWLGIVTESYLILASFAVLLLITFSAFYQEVMETEYYEYLEDEL